MILARIREEGERQGQSPSWPRNPFRGTNYTIHRSQKYQSVKSTPQSTHESPQPANTTTFMRNYVDKLKRQHRRERRRVLANGNKHDKPQAGFVSGDALPLVQPHDQRILVLQKIHPGSFTRECFHPNSSARTLEVPPLASITQQIQYYRQRLKQQKPPQHKRTIGPINSPLPFKKRSTSERLPEVRTEKAIQVPVWEVDPWQGDKEHSAWFMEDNN